MRLLLDTHLALWWQSNDARLSRSTVDIVRNQADHVYVSGASLWEIAIKVSIGRLEVDVARFARSIEASGFEWLDIGNAHLVALASLPTFDDHRDPFDRLLVAQSQVEPLLLLTADAKLARYGQTVRVV